MSKVTKKDWQVIFVDQAKKMEWCDLAYEIMMLERSIEKDLIKDPKQLKLLQLKLEIYESEKFDRISDSFDMGYFLTKEVGLYGEEDE